MIHAKGKESWNLFDVRWRNPFVDVNEALGIEIGNLVIVGKCSVPSNETILKIGNRIAVCVLDDGEGGLCCSPLPYRSIMRRKPRQRTNVPYDSKSIQILEQLESHTVGIVTLLWISVVRSAFVWYSWNTFSYMYP